METNTNTKLLKPKMNSIKDHHKASSLQKEKTTYNAIIIMIAVVFSSILLLVKISWNTIDWKTTLVPLMIAAQIIFLTTALKNRYKKL